MEESAVAQFLLLSRHLPRRLSKPTKAFDLLNPLNAEINTICHLLALLGAHHILHVSRIWVNIKILRVKKVIFRK